MADKPDIKALKEESKILLITIRVVARSVGFPLIRAEVVGHVERTSWDGGHMDGSLVPCIPVDSEGFAPCAVFGLEASSNSLSPSSSTVPKYDSSIYTA
jgi:hypothetical protein